MSSSPRSLGSDRADADFSPFKICLEGAPRAPATAAANLPSPDRKAVGQWVWLPQLRHPAPLLPPRTVRQNRIPAERIC